MIHGRTGTRRCAARTRSAIGGKGDRRDGNAGQIDGRKTVGTGAGPDQASQLPARLAEGVPVTRLHAIRALLRHVRRNDPEMFRQLMCELLGGLGFADVNAAFDYLVDRDTPPHFPIL